MEDPSAAAAAGALPPPNKRFRGNDGAIVSYQAASATTTTGAAAPRTSSLPAPTLRLTGHKGSVYSLNYSPSGRTLCSASFDMNCLLWHHGSTSSSSGNASNVDDDDDDHFYLDQALESYQNFNVLTGHKNAVLDCHWCDEDVVVTCSADKTVQLWDALTGKRLRKWQEHAGIVNACATVKQENTIVSASDDGSCLLWDRRQKRSAGILTASSSSSSSDYGQEFPVTAVAAEGEHVYSAGLDGLIYCWDIRKQQKVYAMKGHTDTITCLAVHPEGTHLLSNCMDHSLRTWDVRPFISGKNRHCKTFMGHKHNAEKGLLKCSWSRDGSMVTAGSADKMVHIWDEFSTEELYLLPGHKGCVNTVIFHPVENVIASGSSDKHIFVGELS